jgi:hypothetical protein
MKIDLVNESTGEVFDTVDLDDETWEQVEAAASVRGITPEEFFKELITNLVNEAKSASETDSKDVV